MEPQCRPKDFSEVHQQRKKWQPTPVFLPGKSHGYRSLAGYRPSGHTVRHNWVTVMHTRTQESIKKSHLRMFGSFFDTSLWPIPFPWFLWQPGLGSFNLSWSGYARLIRKLRNCLLPLYSWPPWVKRVHKTLQLSLQSIEVIPICPPFLEFWEDEWDNNSQTVRDVWE